MSIRELFRCRYNTKNFHCVHFAILAAKKLYNRDYSSCFIGLTSSLDEAIKTSRQTANRNKRIDKPIDGCIVLMTYMDNRSHVGIYHENKILHLCERGVQRVNIEQAKMWFKRIRYYEPNICY